jgi:hypothetical protein
MAVAGVNLNDVPVDVTDEQMIVRMADDIIREREAKGQKVAMPGGKTLDDANAQADYPPAIWREASEKWKKLGSAVQQRQKQEQQTRVRAALEGFRGLAAREAFSSSFSLFDGLWFFLAAATAYKLGHGNIESDDD